MKGRQFGATARFRKGRYTNCPLKEETLEEEEKDVFGFRTEDDTGFFHCGCNDNRSVTLVSNVQSVELLDTCRLYEKGELH